MLLSARKVTSIAVMIIGRAITKKEGNKEKKKTTDTKNETKKIKSNNLTGSNSKKSNIEFIFLPFGCTNIIFVNWVLASRKRFYTRGTLRNIRISRLAKISTFYHDWLRSLN